MEKQVLLPKKNKNLKKVLLVCTMFFIFSLCICMSCLLSSVIIPSSTQVGNNLSTPPFKLYFLSLNKSQLSSSAKTLAGDYISLGAGGYIWKKDIHYHIISSVFEKENDAILVQNNIKVNFNLDSQIFSIDFPALSYSGDIDNESKKVLAKTLKAFYQTYLSLFDIAISLDTNVYNDISARLAINGVYTSFNSIVKDFETLFENLSDQYILKLENTLKDEVKVLESLCSGKLVYDKQTFPSLIKYRYTEFLEIYHNFLTG